MKARLEITMQLFYYLLVRSGKMTPSHVRILSVTYPLCYIVGDVQSTYSWA